MRTLVLFWCVVTLLIVAPGARASGPDKRARMFIAIHQWWQPPPQNESRLRELRAENQRLRRSAKINGAIAREKMREVRLLRRLVRLGYQVRTAISLGAIAYRQSEALLLRKASCESHLWPFARNNSSKDSPPGLFQFRPSTWASTPYASFSIWDPFAQGLAAGWMHANGRGREWACR